MRVITNEELEFALGFRDYYTSLNPVAGELDPIKEFIDIYNKGNRYRIYTPNIIDSNAPTILFIHGGGWLSGNIETHHVLASALANRNQCVTVSIDYRLAPEYPFPAGIEDCYDALLWIKENINLYQGNPSKIVVAGDSAGGNLAIVLALVAKDRNADVNISSIIAMYPVTSYSTETDSFKQLGEDFFPQTDVMKKFLKYYIGEEELLQKNPFISPLHADFEGIAPMLLLVGDKDPLQDGVKEFSVRLNKFGVKNEFILYSGVEHGFIQYFKAEHNNEQGEQAINKIKKFISDNI